MVAAVPMLKILVVLLLFQAPPREVASACPTGHNCPNSEFITQSCPPGTYYRQTIGGSGCEECPDGFYQDKSGQTDCTACPDGHMCPAPKTRAIPCPIGTCSKNYRIPDRISCSTCDDGTYQDKPGQKWCLTCPDGHMCPAPKTRAIPCPIGTCSNNDRIQDRISCWTCHDGTYQDKPGQKWCLACPDGHRCPVPKTRPIPCPPGTYSNERISDRLLCKECWDGSFQDKPGQSYCQPCPQGSFCPPPKNRAIPCPAGSASAEKIDNRVSCETCSDGLYQDKIGQSKCLLCPEGHLCPWPKNVSIPCPPGHVSGYWRYQNQLMNCLACDAGHYVDSPGQKGCNLCPHGHFCPQKESDPVPCPPGFTSATIASQRISCVKCSAGQCLAAVPPPVICPAGMYLDGMDGTCKACETGQYQAYSGQNGCLICPEGFYCPNTTKKPIPCPIGTFSTKEMGLRTLCPACSIGTYQTEQGQNFCLECPGGHFCPHPSSNPIPCPAGSYSSTSTTDRTKCLPCSGQEYQDQIGQQACKPCPAGYLCRSPNLSPQQCPPTTYSLVGHTDRGKCVPCSIGYYQDQCGQSHCKGSFANDCSDPKPSLPCNILNTSEIFPHTECDEQSQNSAAGAPVQRIEGKDGFQYPPLSSQQSVTDNPIQESTVIAFQIMATAAMSDGVLIATNPGKSSHGKGLAIDLNTDCGDQTGNQPPLECIKSAVYMWLKYNGHRFGFVRTVLVEPWHWEFISGPVEGPSAFT